MEQWTKKKKKIKNVKNHYNGVDVDITAPISKREKESWSKLCRNVGMQMYKFSLISIRETRMECSLELTLGF